MPTRKHHPSVLLVYIKTGDVKRQFNIYILNYNCTSLYYTRIHRD